QYQRDTVTQNPRGRGGSAPRGRGGSSRRTYRSSPPRHQDRQGTRLEYRDDSIPHSKSTISLTSVKADDNPTPQPNEVQVIPKTAKPQSVQYHDTGAKPPDVRPKDIKKTTTIPTVAKPQPVQDHETGAKPLDVKSKDTKKSTTAPTKNDQSTPIENPFQTLCDLGEDDSPLQDNEDLDPSDTCSVISSCSDNTGFYESSTEIEDTAPSDNLSKPKSTPITSVWTSPSPPLSQNCGKAPNDLDGLSQAIGKQ
ncbi:unnamed protein product, partial [Owenia fusiformis]